MNDQTIAANAMKWAMSKVGCAYSQPRRTEENSFDCSSLVARAYAAQGKQWRYGGRVPLSNQEVYDDDFELLWPEHYEDIGRVFGKQAQVALANRAGDLQFLCTDKGTSRENKITHVAMVAENGQIVHARGRAYGVCTNSAALYSGKICALTRYHPGCTLRMGMKGFRTLRLQKKLNTLGANLTEDGEYGDDTANAVKVYQATEKLPVTGQADAVTLRLLGLASDPESSTDRAKQLQVTGDTVNIRSGPGTQYSSLGIVHGGDILEAAEADGWQPVLVNGRICWISEKYVRQVS